MARCFNVAAHESSRKERIGTGPNGLAKALGRRPKRPMRGEKPHAILWTLGRFDETERHESLSRIQRCAKLRPSPRLQRHQVHRPEDGDDVRAERLAELLRRPAPHLAVLDDACKDGVPPRTSIRR
jgi:hypothetical protein